jgi:hypothetical protein
MIPHASTMQMKVACFLKCFPTGHSLSRGRNVQVVNCLERITILYCCNMDGSDKRPLFVIGKLVNLRGLDALKTSQLSCFVYIKYFFDNNMFKN